MTSSKTALLGALKSPTCTALAARMADRLQRLAKALDTDERTIAFASHCCQSATVEDFLQSAVARLDDEISMAAASRQTLSAAIAERRATHAAAIRGIPQNLFSRQNRIEALRKAIAGASEQLRLANEKYRAAGLSEEQIASLGVEPTDNTVAEWREEAARLTDEVVRLSSFLKDSADATLLDGIVLAPLPAQLEAINTAPTDAFRRA